MAVRPNAILGGLVVLALAGTLAAAQDAPPGLQTGPATVAQHWTKNTSYPDDRPRGDRLPHRGARGHPLGPGQPLPPEPVPLAPDLGREQAHHGRPLDLPGRPGRSSPTCRSSPTAPARSWPWAGPRASARASRPRASWVRAARAGGAAAALRPVTEEISLQCAMYVVTREEDESLYIIGSELGGDKVALCRARHRLPEQGEQRRRQGRRPLQPPPRVLPGGRTR